jgi:hypothetical protein
MQGNNKPLAIEGDWAMTFDNCKGTKVPAKKSITPIAIPYICNEVPYRVQ